MNGLMDGSLNLVDYLYGLVEVVVFMGLSFLEKHRLERLSTLLNRSHLGISGIVNSIGLPFPRNHGRKRLSCHELNRFLPGILGIVNTICGMALKDSSA
jgi:hypothetical protein